MATIMEKDVLLEMVATATAFISTRTDDTHPRTNEMWNLRKYFLYTPYREINFEENVAKIKPIIDELKNQPSII